MHGPLAARRMSQHFHPLRVHSVERDPGDAAIVCFDIPEALRDTFAFKPGQYLTVRSRVGGQDLRRSYSICAGTDDPLLRVGVRRVEGGAFSAWANEALRAGDTIDVFPPQGHFHVPVDPQARRHWVGIAAGSGITPILGIMRTVLAREPGSRFTLIYGNRRRGSMMFRDELEDLKNRYMERLALHFVFSREAQDAPLLAGRLERAKVGEFLHTLLAPDDIDEVFVCGPHEMNDEAEAALREAGVAANRIHIERFGVPDALRDAKPHEARPDDAEQARVVVIRDGVRRELEFRRGETSILDAAIAAGMDLPYSCQSGVCATCRARLLEGRVRMDRNFALEPQELADGFILTCQSHPLTPQVVVSFDER